MSNLSGADERRLQVAFDRFKSGDSDALVDFVELERPILFDYLFRMSGQRDTVVRVLDETVLALKADTQLDPDSVEDLRVIVYQTARSFCGHTWNADTSELVNEGYGGDESDKQTLLAAEKMMAVLPGWEREPMMLSFRYRFSISAIAKVMSTAEKSVEESIQVAVNKLSPITNHNHALLLNLVRNIPMLPLSAQQEDFGTVAISQIMVDIDQAKKKSLRLRNVLFVAFVVIVMAIIYVTLNPR